jgi:hypothetical protein
LIEYVISAFLSSAPNSLRALGTTLSAFNSSGRHKAWFCHAFLVPTTETRIGAQLSLTLLDYWVLFNSRVLAFAFHFVVSPYRSGSRRNDPMPPTLLFFPKHWTSRYIYGHYSRAVVGIPRLSCTAATSIHSRSSATAGCDPSSRFGLLGMNR